MNTAEEMFRDCAVLRAFNKKKICDNFNHNQTQSRNENSRTFRVAILDMHEIYVQGETNYLTKSIPDRIRMNKSLT